MASVLEQFRIADFVEWHTKKALTLNPEFQRRSVWSPSARIFLIDTILRRLPIPKVFMRTIIDVKTKRSVREVVDGQQRMRAILDFANDQMTLSSRAKEFRGLRYSTLPDDLKQSFLTYPIAVEQLINASDSDVLEVFARLNSYNVVLSPAEKRHARFQGEFKWAVHEAATQWSVLWERFRIITTGQRVRMVDDAMMAEMWGFVLEGIKDGDDRHLRDLYQKYDSAFPEGPTTQAAVDAALTFITERIGDVLRGPLASMPSCLMLFAAIAHALSGIPAGAMAEEMPGRDDTWLSDEQMVKSNLLTLAAAIEENPVEGRWAKFVAASKANTHRMASRRIRFPIFCEALRPIPLEGPA